MDDSMVVWLAVPTDEWMGRNAVVSMVDMLASDLAESLAA